MSEEIPRRLDLMEGFNQLQDDQIRELIGTLFNTEDIELKTEIKNPHAIAGLKTVSKRARTLGLTKTAQTIDDYIQDLLEAMVSLNRKSREEFVNMFKSLQNFGETESIAEKHEIK